MLDLGFNTEDGVLVVDYNGRVAFWNLAAQRMLGFRAEEVLGRPCQEVLRGRDEQGEPICLRECEVVVASRQGQGCPSRDVLVPTRRGRLLWVDLISLAPSRHYAPRGTVVHIFHDIDQRKRLELLARRVMRDLAELGFEEAADACGRSRDRAEPLTNRERQVLELLAHGLDARKIGASLCITEGTARKHIQNILAKLGAHGQVEAISYAVSHRLVSLEKRAQPPWASTPARSGG